ncbi:MAG: ABC transporter ATP-binding protein [Sodalis sp. (in: enterobacteria)]|uniref:ABC transporter ATP-binding protein n=1 Tax=Sodalis sp. (in: enterobacteria) TaxID=1898979 RepID=UPI003F2E4909
MSGHVVIDDISIRYGGRRQPPLALDVTRLDLAPGTFSAIIGPSGCGKSTLLNAVAGFIPPASGEIRIDGLVLNGPCAEVGVIFQHYALFLWLTALGNVKFALNRFKLPRAELHQRALATLEEVGPASLGHHYPGQLSGGQKQRVVMWDLLLRVCQKHRATVLFITYDVGEALLLADRIEAMSAAPGKIIRSRLIARMLICWISAKEFCHCCGRWHYRPEAMRRRQREAAGAVDVVNARNALTQT